MNALVTSIQESSSSQTLHDLRHGQRGLGCFGSTIVGPAQAAYARLSFAFQEKHLMNDRNFIAQLDFHESPTHSFADMRGVSRFTPENNAQADNC